MSSASLGDNEQYRLMMERLPAGVLVHDDQGTIRFANRAAGQICGFALAADLVGRPIGELLPPPFLKTVRLGLLAQTGNRSGRVRVRLTRSDGSATEVELSEAPFLAGGACWVQLAFTDLLEPLAVDGVLALTESRAQLLSEQVPGVVWTADPDGKVVTWSGRLGFVGEGADWRGRPVAGLLGSGGEALLAAQAQALAGAPAACEFEHFGHAMSVHVEPWRDAAGEVLGTIGIAADVTQLRNLEDQRRQDQRLESLARLAGGVAHEVNNVLGAILARTSALDAAQPKWASAVRADLRAIMDAAQRGGAVTANLLGFARGGRYRRDRLSVNALALEGALTARRRARARVAVSLEGLDADLEVEGDGPQLGAAIAAVCENALEATVPGGHITLSVHAAEASAVEVSGAELPPGCYAVVEIADTGTGMAAEVRDRAFEPYFTTHPAEGRGLGLSMVYGVLRHHGGFVRITSAVGEGTRVSLYLPVASPAPVIGTPEPARPGEGSGVVLVVDDDRSMRTAARHLLERHGYRVVEAADGPACLASVAARTEPFDFILLDLRMPGMSGDEVVRALVGADPDVRVVLCTGYERDERVRPLLALGHVGFLQKPYSVEALRAQIQRVRPRAGPSPG